MEWNDLERMLASTDADATETLTKALVRLDDRHRRSLSAPLTKYAKNWWRGFETASAFNPGQGVPDFVVRRYESEVARMEMMRLAVVGTTSGAAAAASWLDREAKRYFSAWRNFSDEKEEIEGREQAERLSRVLATRDDAWVLDLFGRLASRLRNAARGEWQNFVITRVGELGIEPPVTNDFLDCWLGCYINHSRLGYEERLERLRADPLLPRMLDALFALDGLGPHFATYLWADYSKAALPTYLESLLEHGDIDRGFLIDGCLRRLIRGGRPSDLAPYRKLLESQALTPDEAAERARDLTALLPDAAPVTAGVALKALRAADEAGLLDAAVVVEAAERVLFRPERKIVRDQLSWLDKAIDRHPQAAAKLVAVTATAFGHESAEVQSRAVKLVAARTALLDASARIAMADLATALPAAERERLSEILGLEAAEAKTLVDVLAPPEPRPMPDPIASIAELAERLAQLRATFDTIPHGEDLATETVEPVLAALVEFRHRDPEGLAAALKPVLFGRFGTVEWNNGSSIRLLNGLMYAALRATGDARPIEIDADILYGRSISADRQSRADRWHNGLRRMPGPERVLSHRLAEIALCIAEWPVPRLVATPTEVTGLLTPSVLIERIMRAEVDGWRPWEFDFQQALLRTSEATEAEIASAKTLTSPAGKRLADWFTGRARPEITVVDRPMVMYGRYGSEGEEVALPLAKAAVRQPDSIRDEDDLQLLDQLRLSFPQRVLEQDVTVQRPDWPRAWSAVLPTRCDVLAAHLVQMLGPEAFWDMAEPQEDRYYLTMLPDLAEADGPTGAGFTACLAFGLNVARTGDRTSVVDACLTLAARDQLDAEALAAVTADLIIAGLGKCTRIATALREIAEAGAARQVWTILAAMLPRLLAAESAPNRLADLMELATRTAETVAAQGEIAAVAAAAGRGGSSKLVKEARRLHEYLTR